jgi:hypothetical protein
MWDKNAIFRVLGLVLVLIVGTAAAITLAMTPYGSGHSSRVPPWWTRHSGTQMEHNGDRGTEPGVERNRARQQAASRYPARGSTWTDHAAVDQTLGSRKLRSNLLLVAAILATGGRHATNP